MQATMRIGAEVKVGLVVAGRARAGATSPAADPLWDVAARGEPAGEVVFKCRNAGPVDPLRHGRQPR